jgi:adenosylmethionine-8-amino-7-oxononanoate aminotransferase
MGCNRNAPRRTPLTEQRNILLVADEIVTGLGRTGEWFNMHPL